MRYDEKENLELAIEKAFKDLYKYDKYLISTCIKKESHVSERGIVFRFGIYFQNYLMEHFSDYQLDTEYNRNIANIKKLAKEAIYPDLILHKRGHNNDNLLVMEFKTWWNSDIKHDQEKIKKLMSPEGLYKYKYGVIAIINKDKQHLEWF